MKQKKGLERNQLLESNFMGLKWDLLRFFRVCDSASTLKFMCKCNMQGR